jgi:hypothetical protein
MFAMFSDIKIGDNLIVQQNCIHPWDGVQFSGKLIDILPANQTVARETAIKYKYFHKGEPVTRPSKHDRLVLQSGDSYSIIPYWESGYRISLI